MVRDKFSFSGILTFFVLGVAVCVLGASMFGALTVDGADCDTEGIWSRGVRPAATSVTVNTEAELNNALDLGVEGIVLGANIALGNTLSIWQPVSIDGAGKTLSFSGSNSPVVSVLCDSIPTYGLVTLQNLTITGGGSAGIEAVKSDSAYKLLDVINCTIRGNSGPGILHSGTGIGLNLFVMNSTITANGACGIFVSGGNPRVDVSHGTIVNNGGGGITHMFGTAIVRGSIILGNANGQVPGERDVSNSVIEGHPLPNPRGNVPGTYAQVFGTNQLANNDTKIGTQTIALIAGSPAINLGGSSEEHLDQRGFPRPGTGKTSGLCDAGAFETQPQSPVPGVTVTLNHTNLALKVDESATLTATVLPADAPNKNVSWQGSGSGIWEIEDIDNWNRRITARSPGNHTMTVIAQDGGATATCIVTITSGDVPPPPPPPVLSKTSLNLAPGDTSDITSTVDGSWDVSDSSVAEISDVDMATLSVSGKTVYVKANALGSATITFTHSDGKMNVPVFVSPQAIVDMNDLLKSDDIGFNILSPDLFPNVNTSVDTNAPVIACYEPSGKPAGIVEVDISDPVLYPNPENVFLPMQYSLGLTEAEISANCAKVGRAIDMANLFASGTPNDKALSEFFNVFVIQKEIMQGAKAGDLARLLGTGSDQLVTPQAAVSARILTMSVNTAERKVNLAFRYMVKDGTDEPKFDGKQIIVGDGLADERIVDPLWTNARKKTGGTDGPAPDGGGGCNAAPGIAGVLMLGIFAIPLIFRKKK